MQIITERDILRIVNGELSPICFKKLTFETECVVYLQQFNKLSLIYGMFYKGEFIKLEKQCYMELPENILCPITKYIKYYINEQKILSMCDSEMSYCNKIYNIEKDNIQLQNLNCITSGLPMPKTIENYFKPLHILEVKSEIARLTKLIEKEQEGQIKNVYEDQKIKLELELTGLEAK